MEQKEQQNTTWNNLKRGLGKASDLASLKMKLGQAKTRRRNAYAHLGELAYTTYRPRTDSVTEDIESAINATVGEITELSQTITELELRIKLLKADL